MKWMVFQKDGRKAALTVTGHPTALEKARMRLKAFQKGCRMAWKKATALQMDYLKVVPKAKEFQTDVQKVHWKRTGFQTDSWRAK